MGLHLSAPPNVVALAVALLAFALAPVAQADVTGPPQTIASGLELPWEVTLVPGGKILFTERPGRVRVIEPGGALRGSPAFTESGANKFLGMVLHPNYAANRFVYLYITRSDGSRVVRLTDDGTNLVNPVTIFSGISTDGNHDGGRIKFGPDGKLYVTTGDVHDPARPQNLDSLNGKILRLEAPGGAGDGVAPADNPFNGAGETGNRRFVWSYGHRHPQGIDWDASGRMWETEHGPSGESYAGGRGSRDEINRIDRGANYGWPVIMGNETQDGMRSPVVSSGDSTTWAPGGLSVGLDGRLYVPMLAGQHLRSFAISGDTLTDSRVVLSNLGRLRDATVGNGCLYFTTSNNSSNETVRRMPFDSTAAQSQNCSGASEPAPTPGPAADTSAPVLELRIAKRQRVLKRRGVSAGVSSSEAGSVTVGGRIYIAGKRTNYGLRKTTKAMAAGGRAAFTTKFSPRGLRAVRRAFARRQRVSAKLTITGLDAAGNRSAPVRTIRLFR